MKKVWYDAFNMKKKILISIIALAGVSILLGLTFFFYINPVVNTTERNGKYFDAAGKQLGYCRIETKQRKLDTANGTQTTYYYGIDRNPVGDCDGDTTGSSINLKYQPHICRPLTLQIECDPTIHPKENGFCATAKYRCVVEN